ncbi:MAG TPA: protein kinase, partial [Candidatus Deferrimicrobium sp.]|nr:protein kinase [Candidatus Deferrimicrobium sp.]
INAIYEDKSGILWIGTAQGLNKFNPLNETFACYKKIDGKVDSLSHNYVNVIFEDSANALWIGAKEGLNLFQRGIEKFSHWQNLSNANISSICETKTGIFWIGTQGKGLYKFDRAGGTFVQYREKDGLPNEVIYCVLSDEKGNLWMSTNKGIAKFDPETKIFKNYDMGDGLQSNEFNGGAYYKSKDMEMFFGGIDGFNAFYPGKIEDNPHIPPIVITDFQVYSESVKINAKSRLKQSITETKTIRLSYQDNVISFDFVALDFSNPQKNKYAYKMEGFESDWNYRNSTRRFVTYTNLDPGTYVFRVKGSNNDEVWNEKGTAITIIIVPPFWKTLWFRFLLFSTFALLSYIIINFIKKYITFLGFWKREKYIGKFKLVERIGSGGMGTIYKAEDTIEKNGLVALKVLREELFPDETHRKRFKQEAAIIDQLDHPNIVKVFERGQHREKLYIVMEYLEGKTLAAKIAEEEKMDLQEILDIIYQISGALKKIHGRSIVHRDLKPENVMLIEKDGKSNFVKLLDFGLARTENQSKITQTGTLLGTVNYMAPEQISHASYSLATDIYSLGVIFYEMATGRIPFPGGKMTQIMGKILSETPMEPILLRPDLPSACNHLITKMMEKDNTLRPTVAEVLA